MAREYKRSQRVGDHIQKELATIIQMPVRDAGLGLVTISAVNLSTDLAHAKIFVTCLGMDHVKSDHQESDKDDLLDERADVLTMLNDNAAQFRHQLSKILTTRTVPKLQFMFDESLEQANRLTSLIDSLHSEDPQK
ncbi:MAG: 30S ribosome-binding factor RbfA [Gammaproteobacteria bacterium]|nr:MAG: 30S ribosome-binding factor RbfA [Gammaproteobacteria bacterium]RKZ65055.1 MAG: 30S ribosome-binding factor RbfA [Gammaproteobacteria bacterium]